MLGSSPHCRPSSWVGSSESASLLLGWHEIHEEGLQFEGHASRITYSMQCGCYLRGVSLFGRRWRRGLLSDSWVQCSGCIHRVHLATNTARTVGVPSLRLAFASGWRIRRMVTLDWRTPSGISTVYRQLYLLQGGIHGRAHHLAGLLILKGITIQALAHRVHASSE